ncbi:hypothetical protein [Streptomyces viridosporus]|uniref:hypothetical protein n=1 Tax=Streptomyces viridosporus TaxID=67581 RepID=UPI00331D1C05
MTIPLSARVYVMTIAVLVCVVGSGACFGFVVADWPGALVGSGAAGVGAGFGMVARPRPAVIPVQPAKGDGYAEGIADAVLLSIAMYEAAVFPLTADAVSEEEQEARRTVAYGLAASEGLPGRVRVSAAAALEAIDKGLDAQCAREAVKALTVAVYEHRHRSLT